VTRASRPGPVLPLYFEYVSAARGFAARGSLMGAKMLDANGDAHRREFVTDGKGTFFCIFPTSSNAFETG
jgi:hypothetical protein